MNHLRFTGAKVVQIFEICKRETKNIIYDQRSIMNRFLLGVKGLCDREIYLFKLIVRNMQRICGLRPRIERTAIHSDAALVKVFYSPARFTPIIRL